MTSTIVDAWDYRITDIAKAGKVFIEESAYNLTYSEQNTLNALYAAFLDTDAALLVDYTDDVINGFAHVQRMNEGHVEYLGYLNKFYVLPDRRHTRAGVRLVELACEWFDNKDCEMSFANAMARIGRDAAFIRLMKLFGYEETNGGTLIRRINNNVGTI